MNNHTASPQPLNTQHISHIAQAAELLVVMDFDGTLAPFSTSPLEVRAEPGAMESLLNLSHMPHTQTMLLSGRNLEQLTVISEQALDSPIHLVGSHGAEPAEGKNITLSTEQQELWTALRDIAEELALEIPGVWVEKKPLSIGMHIRSASNHTAALQLHERYRDYAHSWTGSITPSITEGKDILEIAVDHTTKGSFLEKYRELLRQKDCDPVIVFAGDDVTDETVFKILDTSRDIGIHVRGDDENLPSTAAQYCVQSTWEMRDVLQLLVEQRRTFLAQD